MAKAYWIATYRSISNPEALAAYAKLVPPAIQSRGGGVSWRAACRRRPRRRG